MARTMTITESINDIYNRNKNKYKNVSSLNPSAIECPANEVYNVLRTQIELFIDTMEYIKLDNKLIEGSSEMHWSLEYAAAYVAGCLSAHTGKIKGKEKISPDEPTNKFVDNILRNECIQRAYFEGYDRRLMN